MTDCEIVRDLLPLYVDGVCSEKSRELVASHIEGCGSCRKMAEELRGDSPQEELAAEKAGVLEDHARREKKSLRRKVIIILSVILVPLLIVYGFLFYLSSHLESYRDWQDFALSEGPWGGDAVWIADDDSLYLICERVEVMPGYFGTEVKAYLFLDGGWTQARFDLKNGVREVLCDTVDGVFFESEIDVSRGCIELHDFTEKSLPSFKMQESIRLVRYRYDKEIDDLPFAYTK